MTTVSAVSMRECPRTAWDFATSKISWRVPLECTLLAVMTNSKRLFIAWQVKSKI
jgi:hypothetical protein